MKDRVMPILWRRLAWAVAVPLLAAALSGCSGDSDLIVGATTSLRDTGLLDELLESFEDDSGYRVSGVTPLIAGSGQVLELARQGEMDVLITHSPDAEAALIEEGHGIDRRPVMENEFLLGGPADDPAEAADAATMAEAFRRIAEAEWRFVSRGDGSGTHVRELAIWEEAGVAPGGRGWYQESAVGQGQNLLVASDKGAYALVDSATFAVFQDKVDLVALATDLVANRYSVVRVNPERHSGVSREAALAFADFLVSDLGQEIIERFGREEYGEALFTAVER
jgi:tungstate transport system substrate-binding protein